MPGERARVWEVCLPASSSSFPNSRNRQGRLQLRRERASRRSQLRGRRGGDWSGRQDPDEARDTHTPARRDRHTDTDTFSHSGPTPRVPPTVQGYPDSSASPANLQNTPWTHTEIQDFAPTSPHKPCGLHTAARGRRGEQKEERQQASERTWSQNPGNWGISCHTPFPKPIKSRQPWPSCQGPCQLPTLPKPPPPGRVWGAGREEIYSSHSCGGGIGLPSPDAHHPLTQTVLLNGRQRVPNSPTHTAQSGSCPVHATQRTGNRALRFYLGAGPTLSHNSEDHPPKTL